MKFEDEEIADLHQMVGRDTMETIDLLDGEMLTLIADSQIALRRVVAHLRSHEISAENITILLTGMSVAAAFGGAP